MISCRICEVIFSFAWDCAVAVGPEGMGCGSEVSSDSLRDMLEIVWEFRVPGWFWVVEYTRVLWRREDVMGRGRWVAVEMIRREIMVDVNVCRCDRYRSSSTSCNA